MLENRELRKRIAWMTWHSKEGHIPSAYSILDLIVFLYEKFLHFDWHRPESAERDFFILSKGHGCSALYAYFEKRGLISESEILSKNLASGSLATHPDKNKVPGVEASTGSLGNGVGFALGIALGLKLDNLSNRVVTILGDAECNEGTVWECALLAPHLKLNNLIVIIDNNKSCNPTLPMGDFVAKFKSFGWNTWEVDGHSTQDLEAVFKQIASVQSEEKPICIIANTVKGKGVPAMETNYGGWHSKVPTEQELLHIWNEIDSYV